jgi:hypothetical protein
MLDGSRIKVHRIASIFGLSHFRVAKPQCTFA